MTHRVAVDSWGVINRLIAERPSFHGETEAGTQCYRIEDEVLFWLLQNVHQGAVTLETGCGYSTVALALRAGHHTVVSPFGGEHELIQAWCRAQGMAVGQVDFVCAPSQRYLPILQTGGLDLALIDGDHAFPTPFIDWYYLAERIKLGGFVMVDDTHLLTGRILRDFLLCEEGRWHHEADLGKTSVFRKVGAGPVVEGLNWVDQPYVEDVSWLDRPVARMRRNLRRAFFSDQSWRALRKRLGG